MISDSNQWDSSAPYSWSDFLSNAKNLGDHQLTLDFNTYWERSADTSDRWERCKPAIDLL